MRATEYSPAAQLIRKPAAVVQTGFGTGCPAGYRTGERIPLHMANPATSFKCDGAFEALEPFLDYIQDQRERGGQYPRCHFVASCDCPISDQEMVFQLFTQLDVARWPEQPVEIEVERP